MRVLLLEEARRQLEAEDEWWRTNRDHAEVLIEDFVEVLRDLMKIPEAGQTYRRTGGDPFNLGCAPPTTAATLT